MGLFSSIMGKFGEPDDLTKKLGDEKDPLKRKELAFALENAKKRGFGENVMGGMKDHFMGKAGNLGFGADGFSMQTLMDAQKARAGQEGGIPMPAAIKPTEMSLLQPTASGMNPQIPAVPTMQGVGPSPAMQTIQAAAQQYQQMQNMPMTTMGPMGLLAEPTTHGATGALNVPPGYESKGKKLLSTFLMGGMGG